MNIQDLEISSVNAVLKYVIGVLVTFIGGLVVYFRFEIKTIRDELKDERLYIKTEGSKNIIALIDNTNVLSQVTKQTEKTGENVIQIKQITETTKPLILVNTDRIKDIKSHLENGD